MKRIVHVDSDGVLGSCSRFEISKVHGEDFKTTAGLSIIISQSLILTYIKATTKHDPEQYPFAWNPQNMLP
jgi:hypothetical protein